MYTHQLFVRHRQATKARYVYVSILKHEIGLGSLGCKALSFPQAEFTSRGTSVVGALRNFGYPTVMIEGGLYLTPLISNTEDLLQQAFNFTRSTSVQL